jgi:hypothetical protein
MCAKLQQVPRAVDVLGLLVREDGGSAAAAAAADDQQW